MKKIFTIPMVVSIITILAFLGVIVFLVFHNLIQVGIGEEMLKLCFQFLLLVVIGGAVTIVFTGYTKLKEFRVKEKEKEKEKQLETRRLQHKFHNDFIQSYNNVKLIRRLVRARARMLIKDDQDEEQIFVNTKIYDNQMQELTRQQLQFEFYVDEVESNPNLFINHYQKELLAPKLKIMADYLNELVSEYEKCYRLSSNQHHLLVVETIPLVKLPVLTKFIIAYDNALDFKKKFRSKAHEVQKVLLQLLSDSLEP